MHITKKKLSELRVWHAEYNKRQRCASGGKVVSFDEYLDIVYGRKKVTKTSNEIPTYDHPRRTPHIPSLNNSEYGNTAKPVPQQYSGERRLLGIGTMHKSNMVPIFSDEEAEDIAKMRRN